MESSFIGLPESFSEVSRLRLAQKIIELIDKGFIQERILIAKLERWCVENREILQKNYVTSTGLVRPSLKHKSSINYLKVVESAELIKNLYGSRWILTKYGNILGNLPKNELSLELQMHEICFFLKHLLMKDFTNFKSLVHAIRRSPILSEISKLFHQNIINELSASLKLMVDLRKQEGLRMRIAKIRKWRRNRLKHIVVPRLNWMVDLKLINWDSYKKGKITLSSEGRQTFNKIPSRIEKNLDEFLNESFYEIFSEAYRNSIVLPLQLWETLSENEREEQASNCVERGFRILGGREIRRVSIVPMVEYSCITLLIEKGIICSFSKLHSQIEKHARSRNDLTYRWVPSDNDGYIRQIG